MVKVLPIDKQGRITLPPEVQKMLHTQPGGKVQLRTMPNGDTILESTTDIRDLYGSVDPKGIRLSVEEMNRIIEEEAVSQCMRSTQTS